MTLVTKTIKGQEYYYYQDSIKVEDKNKIITTCVCRADISGQKLIDEKQEAIVKHFVKMLKTGTVIGKQQYKFDTLQSDDPIMLNDTLDYIRFLYNGYRKMLNEQELEDFSKILFVKYVHGTTAIEGNTLTEDEAYRLLASDLTPQNKSVNETYEVANYTNVQEYISKCSGNVTERMVLQIHKLLMSGIRGTNRKLINAGEYRTGQAILMGIEYRPPPAEMVSSQLKLLLAEYESKIKDGIHPLEAASYFHQKFEEVHPFQDGNGRVGREILNYMLTQEGFPPIYVTPKQRSEYLSALQDGNTGNHIPLFVFWLSRMAATIHYLLVKTNLFSILVSNEAKEFAKELGADEVYDNFLTVSKKARDDPEPP